VERQQKSFQKISGGVSGVSGVLLASFSVLRVPAHQRFGLAAIE
jgi:hypothetical protein